MVSNSNCGYRRPWNSTTSKRARATKLNSLFVQLSIPNFDHSSCCPIPFATPLFIMPPKEKPKASGSTEKKPAPKPAAAKPAQEEVAATTEGRTSKPDQTVYQAEQNTLKKEIDEVTVKFVCTQLFICQRNALLTPYTPNGRILSRRRLTAPREVPGTNERTS